MGKLNNNNNYDDDDDDDDDNKNNNFPLGKSVEAPYSFCVRELLHFMRFLYFIAFFF